MTHGMLTRRIVLIHSLVGAVCMLVVSIAAEAQQRRVRPSQQPVLVSPVRATPASVEGDADLPVIAPRASRTQIDPPSLQLDAGPADAEASPPAPLTSSQKVALIKGSGDRPGGDFAAPDNSLQSISLTAKTPYVHNKGYVGFSGATLVHTISGRVSFPDKGGPFLWISVNVVGGERYLVDLLVFGTVSQTFKVSHEGGQQSFDESAGGNHLLFVLEPSGSGYVSFILEASDYFSFYEAEISRVD